jgi:hypothetical protein
MSAFAATFGGTPDATVPSRDGIVASVTTRADLFAGDNPTELVNVLLAPFREV